MFVAQLERKKEVNSAFFYKFEVDEQGRLMRLFWADAISKKIIVFLVMPFQLMQHMLQTSIT
jgi:hypothetical protein